MFSVVSVAEHYFFSPVYFIRKKNEEFSNLFKLLYLRSFLKHIFPSSLSSFFPCKYDKKRKLDKNVMEYPERQQYTTSQ